MIPSKSVLIVGNIGAFQTELVNKFYKEGWHISLLSEQQGNSHMPGEIEQYHFAYTSPTVKELIESCKPQLIVFTGAYDTQYTWQEDSQEADTSTFIAGLNNILLCANTAEVKQFVYVSSEEIFSDSSDENLAENTLPSPRSPRGLCVLQGETMVASLGRFSQMETTIVRMGNLYAIPRSKEDCTDRMTQLCLSAMLTGSITINSKRLRAPLFAGDAVYALYQIVNAPVRSRSIYHLSSEEPVSEADIAQAIKFNFEKPITVVDRASGPTDRLVLAGTKAAEELSFTARTDYKQAIAQIVTFMEEHRKNYGGAAKRSLRSGFKHIRDALGSAFPLIECILYFIPFYLLNSIHTEIPLLARVDFLLLFVFLFALIRGRTMSIVAFFLGVLGHYVYQSQSQGILQLLISVETYVWIVQLFVVGISTGYLRDKLMQSRREGLDNEMYLKKRLDEMTAINASNAKIKNYYAENIVSSDESIGWFHEVIAELDRAENGEVVFLAAKLLMRLMGTDHVSIYTMDHHGYCRLSVATSARAMALGKSIQTDAYPELFNPLMEKSSFFNQEIVSDLPSMASALSGTDDSSERLFIFLWDMPFEKKTLQYSNLLKVVGTLIYNATMRSARYLDALAYQRYIPDTQLLTKEAFLKMTKVYQKVRNIGLTQFSILKVKLGPDDSKKKMDRRIHACIRQTDIIGLLKKRTIGIILPNSTPEEGNIVKERLAAAGIHAKPYEFNNIMVDPYDVSAVVPGSGIPYKERIVPRKPHDAGKVS